MTSRKRKGVGFFISGAAFVAGGIVAFAVPQDPSWWPMLLQVGGLVAAALGFRVVFPDLGETE